MIYDDFKLPKYFTHELISIFFLHIFTILKKKNKNIDVEFW